MVVLELIWGSRVRQGWNYNEGMGRCTSYLPQMPLTGSLHVHYYQYYCLVIITNPVRELHAHAQNMQVDACGALKD